MDIAKQMKAVVLTGHGEYDKLQYREDIPTPSPRANEVLIKVKAAAVNNTDINTRIAWYSKSQDSAVDASWSGQALQFPRIQGADVCGEIVAIGEHVNSQRLGERVLIEPCITDDNGAVLSKPHYFGSECNGGFAQYTVISARHAHRIDSALSDIELASFPCSYSTAENMLCKANVSATDTVLISGASGGVGSAAVQLAKARGATVIAITSSDKAEQIRELGAAQCINRDANIVTHLGVNSMDVVIDLVAGPSWPMFLEVLKPGGRYAVAGAIAGPLVELDVRTLYLKDLSFFGCTVLAPQVFTNLIAHIEQGRIKPLVGATFELKDIAAAQQQFLKKQHIGKIVLSVPQ